MPSLIAGFSKTCRWLVCTIAVLFTQNALAQDSVEFSDLVERAATVTAIDREQRALTLRGPDGTEVTLQASPDLRNFDQLQAGDIVRFSYEQYYSATRLDPDATLDFTAAASTGAVRAEEGERPGVAMGMMETIIVMIESIGPDGRSATFITADGELQAIFVRRPESREFAMALQPGDVVQLTVAEAFALLVEPLNE